MGTILLLGDEPGAAHALKVELEGEGYRVQVAGARPRTYGATRDREPDVLILQVLPSNTSGAEAVQLIRALLPEPGTREARPAAGGPAGEDATGADGREGEHDTPAPKPPPEYRFADLAIRPAARTVLRAGEEVALTPKEFDLLLALVQRDGVVASRAALMREIWGPGTDTGSRTVDTHVFSLRQKLEPSPSAPTHIVTVPKLGYRWRGTVRRDRESPPKRRGRAEGEYSAQSPSQ